MVDGVVTLIAKRSTPMPSPPGAIVRSVRVALTETSNGVAGLRQREAKDRQSGGNHGTLSLMVYSTAQGLFLRRILLLLNSMLVESFCRGCNDFRHG